MSIFADAWEWGVDAVEDAWDATGRPVLRTAEEGFRSIPGGNEMIELMHDFANTGVGELVLRAWTTYAYNVLSYTPLGPQFAAVVFAVPGLVKGDRFDEAWLVEFRHRAETAASMVLPGLADKLGQQLTDALHKIASDYVVGQVIEMGVQEVAKRYNVREDVAAFAVALWNKVKLPSRDAFDPVTGRQVKPWSGSTKAATQTRQQTAREYAAVYGAREHELLYGDRERAALFKATEPEPETFKVSGVPVDKLVGPVAIAAVGIGALYAWRRGLI